MPNYRLNHDQCRHKVCVVCLGKAKGKITPRLKELIVNHVFDGYIWNMDHLPCAICDTCRISLGTCNNPDPRKRIPMPKKCDHVQLLHKIVTCDITSTCCTCDICESAKAKGGSAANKSSTKQSRGRPSRTQTKKPVTMTLCSVCKGTRKRFVTHKCNEIEKYKNVQQLLSPKSQELVSSTFIRQKSSSECSKSESTLMTRGRPMKVTVPGIHKLESPKPQISHQTLLNMQAKRNLSDIATLNIAQDLRQGGGDVEPKFKPALLNRGKLLSDYFEPKVIP